MPPKKTLKSIIQNLGIDLKPHQQVVKSKAFNKVKDIVNLTPGFNYMSDLLFLPTASYGYKYLLVLVDLASNKFDIQEIKDKESNTVLKSMQKIFERGILKKPEYSLKTDSGSEFKGVFHKWLYDESILHRVSPQGYHQGLANVENLNKQLGRIIMTWLSDKEQKKGKVSKNWLPLVPIIRKELNEARDITDTLPKDMSKYIYPQPDDSIVVGINKNGNEIHKPIESKFREGDEVYYYLTHPIDSMGKKQNTPQRRQGDINWSRHPAQISNVYLMGTIPFTNKKEMTDLKPKKVLKIVKPKKYIAPLYRYKLDAVKGRTFTDNELRLA